MPDILWLSVDEEISRLGEIEVLEWIHCVNLILTVKKWRRLQALH